MSDAIPLDPGKLPGLVKPIFTTVKLQGIPLVSHIRPATVTTVYDWMVCMKTDAPGSSPTYAVFFKEGAVSHYRIAVQVDQCEGEQYVPLASFEPPPPPPATKKKKK